MRLFAQCALASALALTTLAGPAQARPDFDWTAYMKKDLVVVSGDRMTYRQIEVCEGSLGGEAPSVTQTEWTAEAPTGVISRDNFVSLISGMQVIVAAQMASEAGVTLEEYMKAFDCTPADSAIGVVDLKVDLIAAPAGIQFALTDTSVGKTNRATFTWQQVFGGDAKSPASGNDPFEAAVRMIEEMAEISHANAHDCGKLADALGTFLDANKERIEAMKRLGKGMKDKEAAKRAEEKYKDRMAAAMGKMMPAQAKCAADPKFQETMKKM